MPLLAVGSSTRFFKWRRASLTERILCGDIANVNRTSATSGRTWSVTQNWQIRPFRSGLIPTLLLFRLITLLEMKVSILCAGTDLQSRPFALSQCRVRREAKPAIRFEAFNALNSVSYGLPINQLGLPGQTGVVTGTRSTEREIQVAVKFYF